MAAQKDGSSLELTTETVGHAFVNQFYSLLRNTPGLVYKFYENSSTMSRPGPDGTLVTVTTMEGIKDLLLSLNYQDYNIEILTADAQASYMKGVIVLVTGCLTGKDNVRRKFTETFFLAPQDNGYYVLNDVFRFIEDNNMPVVNSVEEKDLKNIESGAPAMHVEETTTEAAPVASDATTDAPVSHTPDVEVEIETVSVSKDESKPIVNENGDSQTSVDSGNIAQAAHHTLSNGHVDAPKSSYASTLLKNMKEGAAMTLAPKPTNPTKPASANAIKKPAQQTRDSSAPAAHQTRASSVSATAPESFAPKRSNGSVAESDGKGYSIYIGGLPYNATPEQVEQEFKRFGSIRSNGVQVRSNKGYCFGFVEYEEAIGKQKAIETGKIVIGGKEATIEEKQTGTKVVNGVSVYPSGRGGGYRNDGFRGRNYSNGGRGHVRNDYGMRNGEGPFRGNRNGDGYVYQNGGGRGARQGAVPK
ncbi:unnamed protein product [Amaranthus hypochondriacus]